MDYNLLENKYSTNTFTDKNSQTWFCIHPQKMEELYPNGGYIIAADLKQESKEKSIGCLIGENQKIEVFPYELQLKSNEKCVGFICISGSDNLDTFIRIVKKTRKKWFLLSLLLSLLVVLVSLIAVFIGGWIIFNENKPNLDKSAISYHIEGMENKNPSNISIPLFSRIKIDSTTMEGKVHLANPVGNPCYFEYHIVLKDGNKELYQSKLIEPGTAIPSFRLNQTLEKGTYPATIRIKTYALSDHTTPMNGGEIDIELIVEEVN